LLLINRIHVSYLYSLNLLNWFSKFSMARFTPALSLFPANPSVNGDRVLFLLPSNNAILLLYFVQWRANFRATGSLFVSFHAFSQQYFSHIGGLFSNHRSWRHWFLLLGHVGLRSLNAAFPCWFMFIFFLLIYYTITILFSFKMSCVTYNEKYNWFR
jgi:hypothetical protein